MKKKIIEYRKATEDELLSGKSEMIKISEIEVDVPDEENSQKIDISNIDINTLPEDQLLILINKIKTLL